MSFSLLADTGALIDIPHLKSVPLIDGSLDETIWEQAANLSHLKQVWPNISDKQNENQEIRVFYSAKYLFLGATLDVDANTLVAKTLRNNQETSGDDTLTLLIDTHSSKRNAFWFSINANGVKNDGLVVNNNKNIIEWDEIWYAKSKVSKNQWTLEMAIPLSLLSNVPDDGKWGINVVRKVAHGQRELRWSNISQDTSFLDPKHFGIAKGITKLAPDNGIDLRYAISASHSKQGSFETDEISPSLDVNYRLTPSTSASLTLNTDFSTTDVDDLELNLGRFTLFKPEKRNFFLQDSAIYEFGKIEKNGKPFFSRKIGLSPDGDEVDINAGVKFSGYGEDWSAGFMSINTDGLRGMGSQQLTVARGTWQFTEQLQAGGIYTQGDPFSEESSETFGLDFNYRSSEIVVGKSLEFGGWLQQSDNEGYNSDNKAWGLFAAYPNDIINWFVSAEELQDNFSPKLGFVNRNDIRHYTLKGRFRHHLNQHGIQLVDTSVNAFITTDLDDNLKTSNVYWNFLDFTSQEGDFLRLAVEDTRENLSVPFNLLGKIPVAALDYHFNRYWLIARTSPSRSWSLHGRINTGKFFDGDKTSISLELKLTPSIHWNSSIKIQTDELHVSQQSLTFNQIKLRLDYIFNNRLSWQNYIQYDDLNRKLGAQSRINWIPEPGFEMNFVFNSRYNNIRPGDWQQEYQSAVVNLSGIWRF
jgi:hypothetical protein